MAEKSNFFGSSGRFVVTVNYRPLEAGTGYQLSTTNVLTLVSTTGTRVSKNIYDRLGVRP